MHTLNEKIAELVKHNDREGLEDLQMEISDVIDFSRRSAHRYMKQISDHNINIEQAEANCRLVQNAINNIL